MQQIVAEHYIRPIVAHATIAYIFQVGGVVLRQIAIFMATFTCSYGFSLFSVYGVPRHYRRSYICSVAATKWNLVGMDLFDLKRRSRNTSVTSDQLT